MKAMVALTASIVAGILNGALATACCLGPFVFTSLGVSGAALARYPLFRPYLLVATYVLLACAFYLTYGLRHAQRAPREACTVPHAGRLNRALLWLGTFIVLLSTLFPVSSGFRSSTARSTTSSASSACMKSSGGFPKSATR